MMGEARDTVYTKSPGVNACSPRHQSPAHASSDRFALPGKSLKLSALKKKQTGGSGKSKTAIEKPAGKVLEGRVWTLSLKKIRLSRTPEPCKCCDYIRAS